MLKMPTEQWNTPEVPLLADWLTDWQRVHKEDIIKWELFIKDPGHLNQIRASEQVKLQKWV